ncbi:hypothetical protein Bbelb_366030 [Branchiostoma belcheri]|nr:hypothetical protein Bbelb_366030 [Branchiostoma belcheri]
MEKIVTLPWLPSPGLLGRNGLLSENESTGNASRCSLATPATDPHYCRMGRDGTFYTSHGGRDCGERELAPGTNLTGPGNGSMAADSVGAGMDTYSSAMIATVLIMSLVVYAFIIQGILFCRELRHFN